MRSATDFNNLANIQVEADGPDGTEDVAPQLELQGRKRHYANQAQDDFPVRILGSHVFDVFDPVRDALTGALGALTDPEHPSGPMEFRKILPGYLTVYPSIKEYQRTF